MPQRRRTYTSADGPIARAGRAADLSRQADSRGGFSQLGPPGAAELVPLMTLQFVVCGKGNRVTVATVGEGGTAAAPPQSGKAERPGFWTTSRRIGAAIVGLATIVAAVVALIELHP